MLVFLWAKFGPERVNFIEKIILAPKKLSVANAQAQILRLIETHGLFHYTNINTENGDKPKLVYQTKYYIIL